MVLSLCAGAFAENSLVVTLSARSTGAMIQNALDSLPPNGEVRLLPGTYEISQPLLLRHDYETLSGSGTQTILHLANHAGCPVVILGPNMMETNHPASHLRLADLLIDGNRKNQALEFWRSAGDGSQMNNNGVQIWNVRDATVEHVTCCRCRSGGLVTADVRRLAVNDFDSYDNQFDGLACYDTEQSRFDDLHLHDNIGAGISLDLSFNHNFVTNAVLAGNDLGIFMRCSRDNRFDGLTISKCHHHGVFMAQSTLGSRLTPDTECAGNNFENLRVNDCGGKAFQVNDVSCTNNAIKGAQFFHNTLGGLGQPATNPVTIRALVER